MNYKLDKKNQKYSINKHWVIGNVFLISFGALMAMNSTTVHAAEPGSGTTSEEAKVEVQKVEPDTKSELPQIKPVLAKATTPPRKSSKDR